MQVERDSRGDMGSRNSVTAAGLPETENLWRERAQHPITALSYSIAAGLFPVPSEKLPREKFYLKLLEALKGSDQH